MAVWNENGTVAFLDRSGMAFRMQGTIADSPSKATFPLVAAGMQSFGEVTPWGDDNLFPQHVIKDYEKSTIMFRSLEKQALMLISQGLVYGTVEDYDKDGNEVMKYKIDPEVENWLKASAINRYLREASTSFYWFYNLFPEFGLSKNRKMINWLVSQRPEYCRWEKQNEKTGMVDHCYISANWDGLSAADKKYLTKVQTIDPYTDPLYTLKHKEGFKYIYPLSFPTPGKSFYQLAPHNSVRTSGWLDVTLSIPAFKKALFKNQITIKFIIEVSTWWWEWQYPGFSNKTPEEKKKIQDGELDVFEKFMTGADNTGKAIITTYQSDPIMKEKFDGWKVTPIDNKMQGNIYIEDSAEASSHLLYALGIDPTIIGPLPSKTGMGAGSGSDKRVAYNIYISMIKPHADVVLEPIQFAFDYNWPDKRLKVMFRKPPEDKQPSKSPTVEQNPTMKESQQQAA